jgi:hypothetical protein
LAPPVASPAANSTPHNPRNFISASLQAEAVELERQAAQEPERLGYQVEASQGLSS